MRWQVLSLTSLLLGWIGLTSCTTHQTKPDPFVCDVQPAYAKDGTIDTTRYNVNRDCLRGVDLRLKACYRETK